MTSVLQPWVMELPLRYQGTLLAGLRGCDAVPKQPYDSTPRQLVAYLRYVAMIPADPREVGVPGAYMQYDPPYDWKPSDLGHLPEHFYSHLMHAFEVVGYECPHPETKANCELIYLRMVENLHLLPESAERMRQRLTEDRIKSGTVVSLRILLLLRIRLT